MILAQMFLVMFMMIVAKGVSETTTQTNSTQTITTTTPTTTTTIETITITTTTPTISPNTPIPNIAPNSDSWGGGNGHEESEEEFTFEGTTYLKSKITDIMNDLKSKLKYQPHNTEIRKTYQGIVTFSRYEKEKEEDPDSLAKFFWNKRLYLRSKLTNNIYDAEIVSCRQIGKTCYGPLKGYWEQNEGDPDTMSGRMIFINAKTAVLNTDKPTYDDEGTHWLKSRDYY